MKFTTAIISTISTLGAFASASPLSARQNSSTTPHAYAKVIAINHPVAGSGPWYERPVNIPLGTLHHESYSITGFALVGLDNSAPPPPFGPAATVKDITCQRYWDEWGSGRGSAAFTVGRNASVSTNQVNFGWVLCWVTPTA